MESVVVEKVEIRIRFGKVEVEVQGAWGYGRWLLKISVWKIQHEWTFRLSTICLYTRKGIYSMGKHLNYLIYLAIS